MAYNTETLKTHMNGSAPEAGAQNPSGLWRHPKAIDATTGKLAEVHAPSDPLFGSPQADALARFGYEFIRESKPEEIKSIDIATVTEAGKTGDSMKGLNARMDAMEKVAERNKQLEAELEALRAKHADGAPTDAASTVDAAAAAKAEAERQTAIRQGEVETADEETQSTSAAPAKSFGKLNATELKALAEAEGIDLGDADTNNKMRAVILDAREAKESENA